MIVQNWLLVLHASWWRVVKFISYNLPLQSSITITSSSKPLTIYPFMLNCTFNPFDISLFTRSKFACNLDIWRTFLMQTFFWLFFTITSIIIESIVIAYKTLSSSKWTLYRAITSYMSVFALEEVMCFLSSDCIIYFCMTSKHVHIALQLHSHHDFWCCLHSFGIVLGFVAKTHNIP